MSYDVELTDPVTREVLHTLDKHQMAGGTYALGGTTKLSLNVTYNYSKHAPGLIRGLHNISASESIPRILEVVDRLGDDVDADYWTPTEGNVKRALLQLVALARMRPDGVWNVE